MGMNISIVKELWNIKGFQLKRAGIRALPRWTVNSTCFDWIGHFNQFDIDERCYTQHMQISLKMKGLNLFVIFRFSDFGHF